MPPRKRTKKPTKAELNLSKVEEIATVEVGKAVEEEKPLEVGKPLEEEQPLEEEKPLEVEQPLEEEKPLEVLPVEKTRRIATPAPPPPPSPPSPGTGQIQDILIMHQMQRTMLEQSQMIAKLMQRLDGSELKAQDQKDEVEEKEKEEEEEEEEFDMDWPSSTSLVPSLPVKEDPLNYRREKRERNFHDVYASDLSTATDKNIILTDAANGTWGHMAQTSSHVGLRTRSLCLNPTLQQPSIGGLI